MLSNSVSSPLSPNTVRGDRARGVVYIDRRLQILQAYVNNTPAAAALVLSAAETHPSHLTACAVLEAVLDMWGADYPHSRVMTHGDIVELRTLWRNSLVSLRRRMQA